MLVSEALWPATGGFCPSSVKLVQITEESSTEERRLKMNGRQWHPFTHPMMIGGRSPSRNRWCSQPRSQWQPRWTQQSWQLRWPAYHRSIYSSNSIAKHVLTLDEAFPFELAPLFPNLPLPKFAPLTLLRGRGAAVADAARARKKMETAFIIKRLNECR